MLVMQSPQPAVLILPYVFLAFGLIASLALFFALKREMRYQGTRHRCELEQLTSRLQEFEQNLSNPAPTASAEPAVIGTPIRSGFNLTHRANAMRLLRRGEDVSHIAAALGVPRKEVELLIRVQRFTAPALRSPSTLPGRQG